MSKSLTACYTYIVECADGSLYTGWTKDLDQRIQAHNGGTGARYTRSRLPVRLLKSWEFATKSQAMSFEYRIKSMPRTEKLRMALSP